MPLPAELARPARHLTVWVRRRGRHISWPRYSWAGVLGAILFACASFTPSLLPRVWLLQAMVAGISAAIGYGLGAFLTWIVQSAVTWRPSRSFQRRAWQALALAGTILLGISLWAGQRWQQEIHRLMGLDPPEDYERLSIVFVGTAVFLTLVAIARGLRWLTRRIAQPLARIVPHRLAQPLAVIVLVTLAILLNNGLIFRSLIGVVNSSFGAVNQTTTPGTRQPLLAERSGSPESLIPWDTLGQKGRDFVALAPTASEIAAFSGEPAMTPIRIYAGLASAESAEERAELAVRDLRRAGGFERDVLAVATTTGSGGVDTFASESLEFMFNGNTAIIALQYSYLPSWISFMVDADKAQEAGQALFDEVYEVWSELPATDRPRLYVYGTSLGSYGSEAAFGGLADVRSRTDGVIWAGPPETNPLHASIVNNRDPGSPAWLPVYEGGEHVRFAAEPEHLKRPDGRWEHPRIVYLQHASDPIVWWTPGLALLRPDWLEEPAGPDVSDDMFWIPFVTFWQVSADLPFALEAPPGHGHNYRTIFVDAWAAVAQPPGWTDADSKRLRDLLMLRHDD